MKHALNPKYSTVNLKDIEYQLDKITLYTEIINHSCDVGKVEHALTRIIDSIDYILSCEDMDLAELGISKDGLPEHKQFIINNRDALIHQAKGRF